MLYGIIFIFNVNKTHSKVSKYFYRENATNSPNVISVTMFVEMVTGKNVL